MACSALRRLGMMAAERPKVKMKPTASAMRSTFRIPGKNHKPTRQIAKRTQLMTDRLTGPSLALSARHVSAAQSASRRPPVCFALSAMRDDMVFPRRRATKPPYE